MSGQARQAINFLRGRQEYSDLRYWLSVVNYDPEERTLSNRIYLVYLIAFFTIWVFIVLLFAAAVLVKLIQIISIIPPVTLISAFLLVTFILIILINLRAGTIRSPLVFTEEQRYLLCQQPIPPRPLVFRWILTPWLQSFLLFALLCLMSGFTFGEITFPPDQISQYFFVYIWYGLRVVLLVSPFHLATFVLSWAVGVHALNHRGKFSAYIPAVLYAIVLLLTAAAFIAPAFFGASLPLLRSLETFVSQILLAFFGAGNFSFGTTFFIGITFLIAALLSLWLAAKAFSPSKAASETDTAALLASYRKFGQTDAIESVRIKIRLGLTRKSRSYPQWQDEKAFAWKAILLIRRSFGMDDLWRFLVTLLLMFSFSFAGNTLLAWLGLVSWVWSFSHSSTNVFKQDLSLWQLTRQVPLQIKKWGMLDLLIPALPYALASFLGLLLGQLSFSTGGWQYMPVVLLGLVSAQLQLGQDILRKNQVELVAGGNLQGFGFRGLLMAIICLLLPLAAMLLPMGPLSFLPGILVALLLAWGSLRGFYRQVDRFTEESKVFLIQF